MRKFKLFLSLLMLMAFSLGNVWGQAANGTTLFSENFSGYAADAVPSGSVSSETGNRVVYGGGSVTYTSADNGSNITKIYSANIAGGTAPELLIGKSGGVFTIAGIPSGGAKEITVSFYQNAQKLTVSLNGTGYSTTYNSPKPTAAGLVSFDITVADGADDTFTLVFTASSSNVRFDDISIIVKTAGTPAGCSNLVTITKGAETNGTYTLSATEICGDGEGEDVTISDITPAAGFAFDEITTSASGIVDNENKKVTGITAATTITVLFKELQKYTVSFNTGAGNPSQADITETTAGAGITLPEGPTPACSADGWTFAGWAAEAVASETTTAPTLLSGKYNPTDNVTLYAVYKRTEEGGVADNSVTETFENQTAGSSYNSTQNYEAANSNANIAWTMYYGTVSTNDKITGANSAQMRWYSSANTTYGYIQNTTAISGLQKISFNARVSNTAVKMSVWYSTNGENWTLIDENLTFDAQSTAKPFSSTINGAVGTDYYIRIGVGDGGTAPSSGNYKLIVDDVKFEYKAGASTTYYLSAPSCCEKHNVNVALGIQYGKVEADLTEACEGTEVTLTATPNEHCRFEAWDVKQGETPVAVTDNKFTMPAGDVTVSATFAEIRNAVNVSNPEHGTISVTGADNLENVLEGTELSVEVSGAGYEFTLKAYKVGEESTTVPITDGKLTMPAYGIVITADEQELVSPTILVSKEVIDFGKAVKGGAAPAFETFTISGANLTGDLSLAWESADAYFAWEVTEGSLAANAGIVEATIRVNVTEKGMSVADTHMDNLIVSGGSATQKEVIVGVEVQQTYTVAWYINGAKKGEQTAIAGAELVNIPDATSIENGAIAGKVFRGWATAIIEGEVDEAQAGIVATPTVMPGEDTRYHAVYATEEGGEEDVTTIKYSGGSTTNMTGNNDAATLGLDANEWSVVGAKGSNSNFPGLNKAGDIRLYYNAGGSNTITITAPKSVDFVRMTFNSGFENVSVAVGGSPVVAVDGAYPINATTFVLGNANSSNVQVQIKTIDVVFATPISYTKYATSGPKKLANPTFGLAEDTYTEAQSVSITAGEGETIYYTLDGTEPTTESTPYTAAIALDSYGSYTIKAIAAKEDGSKSDVVTATYGINIPFETVSDLFTYIESGKAFLGNISVTGVVSKIVTEYSTEHSNITFNISDTGAESEAQFQSYRGVGEGIAEKVAVGDKVTITGEYTLYGTTHELKQGNTISNRVAAEVSSVVISGEAINTEYFYNDDFSFAGLVATAIYNTGYTKVVTEEANVWSADPAQVTATGNVNVTATYGGKTSDAKVVAVTKQLRTITNEQLAWTAGAATAYTVGKAYTLPTLTNELGLAVIYTSETPETATISNEEGHEGEISIVAAGSTVITASFAGNDEYATKEVSYTLTVYAPASVVVTGDATKKAYEAGETFSFEGLGAKATYADEAEYEIPAEEIAWTPAEAPVITENTTVEVTATWQGLTSAKKDVAVTVNTHAITIETPTNGTLAVKNGEEAIASGDAFAKGTVLTVETTPASEEYKAGVVTVTGATLEGNTITVGSTDFTVSATFAEKAEAGIEWKDTEYGTKAYEGYMQVQGDKIVERDLPELYNPNKLTIEYRSDNTDVAEIDPVTGVITPKAEGYTTISAIFAGNDDYLSDSVSFVLTVAIDQLKFYVIGSFNDWKEFVPVYDTWYQFENLEAGNYQLKVTTAPNWDDLSQVYGYDALTIKHAGLSKNNDNGNICFTISNESSGTVIVSFEKDGEDVKTFTVIGTYAKPTFTVVGVEVLVGYNWGDGLNAYENEMAEDLPTENYILEKENVMLAAGDYEYQVAMNHDWRYGASNSTLSISESGIYTVTFTYVPSTGATSAEALLIEPIEVLPTMKIAGNWDVDSENSGKWNENELIVAGDEKTASYTAKNLVKDQWYQFWIIKNGVYMSGKNGFDRNNLSKDLTTYYTGDDAYAMYFQADQNGDYTFTWTYETNVITMTFPYKEATALDNTEAGETAVKVMKNGQLMIMKNGKTYNAQGQIIK